MFYNTHGGIKKMKEKLKELRKNAHLYQTDVCQATGIKLSSYKQYETNRATPDIDTLKKIANFYDVSLDYLCGRENKNLIFIDTLSPVKKELINIIKSLNDEQATIAVGYLGKMANKPLSEIMEITLKNK